MKTNGTPLLPSELVKRVQALEAQVDFLTQRLRESEAHTAAMQSMIDAMYVPHPKRNQVMAFLRFELNLAQENQQKADDSWEREHWKWIEEHLLPKTSLPEIEQT